MFEILFYLYVVSIILSIIIMVVMFNERPFSIIQMHWLGYLIPFTPVVNTVLVLENIWFLIKRVYNRWYWRRQKKKVPPHPALDHDICSLYPHIPVPVELLKEKKVDN